jgi:hypothetical protein
MQHWHLLPTLFPVALIFHTLFPLPAGECVVIANRRDRQSGSLPTGRQAKI